MKNRSTLRIGFVGFGEVNTPRECITERCAAVAQQLVDDGFELVRAGPVADDPAGVQAARARAELARAEFCAVVICVAGWIPSWAVLAVIEPFRHLPMILLGLTGWKQGDRFVTTADQAGTTALRQPMAELGYKFKYVVTPRGSEFPLAQLRPYLRAAQAARRLRTASIGMAGYRDMRLYGTLYDGISLKKQIGPEIEHFDLLELKQSMDTIPDAEVRQMTETLRARWRFLKDPQPGRLNNRFGSTGPFDAKSRTEDMLPFRSVMWTA